MKLKIEITMDNEAFDMEGETRRFRNGYEPARILERLAAGMKDSNLEIGNTENLRDINGNKVGCAKVTR
jgi:hypothetical protein